MRLNFLLLIDNRNGKLNIPRLRLVRMGRDKIEIDPQLLLDLSERGLTQRQIAEELGLSIPTIATRIKDLQQEQGVLLQYKALEGLHLTKLRARILEQITPEKIESADLKDLVYAYKVLKGAELTEDTGQVKGLVAYLIQIEKEQVALINPVTGDMENCIDITPVEKDENV